MFSRLFNGCFWRRKRTSPTTTTTTSSSASCARRSTTANRNGGRFDRCLSTNANRGETLLAGRFNRKWVGLSLMGISLLAVGYSFSRKTSHAATDPNQTPTERSSAEEEGEGEGGGEQEDNENGTSGHETDKEQEKYYDYVVVGSSMAAKLIVSNLIATKSDATILWIHENEPTIKYPLTADGVDYPEAYIDWQEKMRTMLWKPDDPEDIDKIKINNLYFLNTKKKELVLAGHPLTKFGKCVLAYSSVPMRLHNNNHEYIQLPSDSSHIITCNSISDLDKLHYLISQKAVQHVTVVGDTLLGLDVAMGLSFLAKSKGLKVAQVVPGEGVLTKLFPKYLSESTTHQLIKGGVTVHKNSDIKKVIDPNEKPKSEPAEPKKAIADADEPTNDEVNHTLVPYASTPTYNIVLDNGNEINTNLIVVAQGNESSIHCAYLCTVSELETKKTSISVNNQLLIADDVWGAGDSINVWLPEHKRRRIQDTEQQYMSAMTVIDNMDGKRNTFSSIPSYLTNLFGRSIAIYGSPDSSDENVGVWSKAPLMTGGTTDLDFEKTATFDTGVVYYLNDDKSVSGLLLVNTPPFTIPQAKAMFRKDRLFLSDRDFITGITLKEETFQTDEA